MEATMVWTGTVTIGGILLVPVLLEFFKRNLSICFGLLMTLFTIYCLTPYSAGARGVWSPISKIPAEMAQVVGGLIGNPATPPPPPSR